MMPNAKQVKLTIDGKEVTVDESLTILEAARCNGIEIPTLCHHPALSNWGGCRLCVVEVDNSPRLAASCVMPVRNGMEVVTRNEAITASRRMTMEMLFAERNHNCMFCPDSGRCELQKIAYDLQMDHLTVSQSFKSFPVDVTGEYMTFDHNRCILCGRCVRACHEIAGAFVLGFHHRGAKSLVGFDLLENRSESGCINCGACLQVCPTGAISSRYRAHYAVKGQPSEGQTITSLCAGCGLLCPVRAVTRDNQLMRLEGLLGEDFGDRPDRGQLCWKGRFEVLKSHAPRLTGPMVKDAQGQWRNQSWEQALDVVTDTFEAVRQRAGAMFGIVSSGLSNESLILFKELMVERWGAGAIDTLDGDHFRHLLAAQGNGSRRGIPDEAPWKQVAAADMVLMVGADPQNSHPVLVSLLRQAHLERKLPVAVIGQVRDAHLFGSLLVPAPGKDLPGVLSELGRLLQGDVPKSPGGKKGLKAEYKNALALIAQAYTQAKSPLIIAGERLSDSNNGGLKELLDLAGAVSGGAPTVFLKPSVNSSAAWRLGIASRQVQENYTGAGLLLLGDEYGDALKNWVKARTAPSFLTVITPYFEQAVASIAHVLLPKPMWMEEDGSYTSLEGAQIDLKPRVLDPPAGVLRTWEILQKLFIHKSGRQGKNWESIRADADKLLETFQS
jgi:formate dehydrogenase major subunit